MANQSGWGGGSLMADQSGWGGGSLMADQSGWGGGSLMADQSGWGGGEPKKKRARRSLGVDAVGEGSSAPATSPASESRAHPESAAASLTVEDPDALDCVVCLSPALESRAHPESAAASLTVEDPDALDCVVCFLPLKPPIFQCDVGHVICSLCRDKLQSAGKCHVCGVATSGYRRCHAMERLVESIRVPCSYAAHGCALRPAYYDQESHRLVCRHAPCHCPGEACSFVGSTAALLDHFSTMHKWPCITTVKPDDRHEFNIGLHDGFNFLLADCSTGNKNKGDTASVQCLLMLTMERQQVARSISVHWIDPHASRASGSQGSTAKEMQCELSLYFFKSLRSSRLIDHYQTSKFRVGRTNLSNGLPKPDDCFQVVVPNSVVGDGFDIDIDIKIKIKEIGVGQS